MLDIIFILKTLSHFIHIVKETLVQAWIGPYFSGKFRLLNFNSRHRPPLTPRKNSWYSFLLEVSRSQDRSAAVTILSIRHSNETTWNRTRHFPACSTVSELSAPPRALIHLAESVN